MVFYEAPHRIVKTLKLMEEVFGDRKAVVARELTKLHEEYIRGTLSQLTQIESFRGELVIVVEGNHSQNEVALEDLLAEVKTLITQGNSTKSAVQSVAEKHEYSKNTLYNEYLKCEKK